MGGNPSSRCALEASIRTEASHRGERGDRTAEEPLRSSGGKLGELGNACHRLGQFAQRDVPIRDEVALPAPSSLGCGEMGGGEAFDVDDRDTAGDERRNLTSRQLDEDGVQAADERGRARS